MFELIVWDFKLPQAAFPPSFFLSFPLFFLSSISLCFLSFFYISRLLLSSECLALPSPLWPSFWLFLLLSLCFSCIRGRPALLLQLAKELPESAGAHGGRGHQLLLHLRPPRVREMLQELAPPGVLRDEGPLRAPVLRLQVIQAALLLQSGETVLELAAHPCLMAWPKLLSNLTSRPRYTPHFARAEWGVPSRALFHNLISKV